MTAGSPALDIGVDENKCTKQTVWQGPRLDFAKENGTSATIAALSATL